MCTRHPPTWLLAVGLWLLAQSPAQADVWAFMDADGHTHFSAEQLDDRYELYFYNPDAHQTDAIQRQLAKDKLLRFFDQSPSYKEAQPLLQEAARKHRIGYELLLALVATESGFDATVASARGAVGLMQLMPKTAMNYGLRANNVDAAVTKLRDPKINIAVGTRYLRDMLNQFPGRLDLALAAYNAGIGSVRQAGDKVPPIRETRAFVKTVLNLHAALKPTDLGANPRHLPIHNYRLKHSRAKLAPQRLMASNP